MTKPDAEWLDREIAHHQEMLVYHLKSAARASEVGSVHSAAASITLAAERASIASALRAMK